MSSTESASNIHQLPENYILFEGCTIKAPTTKRDFIRLCRRFLNEKDYRNVMKGIFDSAHYDQCEDFIQKVIDNYYSFPGER